MQMLSLVLPLLLLLSTTAIPHLYLLETPSADEAMNEMVDRSFGVEGIVQTAIGPGNASAQAVAVQPDGKILAAGFAYNGLNDDFAVARYNRNGQLDPTFGGGTGIVTTPIGDLDDQGYAIALQQDGKFVVAGQIYEAGKSSVAAVRYDPDGTIDTTFGLGGKVVVSSLAGSAFARSIALDSSGRIFIAGNAMNGSTPDILTICLSPNGELDAAFDGESGNANGIMLTPVGTASDQGYGVAVQADGKIVVAGYFANGPSTDTVLIRYLPSGQLDIAFGINGIARHAFSQDTDEALALALAPDGKILIGGCIRDGSPNNFLVARFLEDGSRDVGFGNAGFTIVPFSDAPDLSLAVSVQADGKTLVAGFGSNGANNDFAVARITGTGHLDPTFGGDGKVLTMLGNSSDFAYGIAISPDGGIVAAGRVIDSLTRFGIVRYHPGTASVSGRVTTPNGAAVRNATVSLLQPDGTHRTAVTGSFGVFELNGVMTGGDILISARSKRYRFAPFNVGLNGNLAGLELAGLE